MSVIAVQVRTVVRQASTRCLRLDNSQFAEAISFIFALTSCVTCIAIYAYSSTYLVSLSYICQRCTTCFLIFDDLM